MEAGGATDGGVWLGRGKGNMKSEAEIRAKMAELRSDRVEFAKRALGTSDLPHASILWATAVKYTDQLYMLKWVLGEER